MQTLARNTKRLVVAVSNGVLQEGLAGAFDLSSKLGTNVNTELTHAKLRILSIMMMTSYGAIMVHMGFAPPDNMVLVYLGIVTLILAVMFLVWVAKSPVGQSWRHWLAMVHDYAAMTTAMAFGGAPFMPLYAFALCAVVGHGLRYGRNALWAATALLTGSLAFIMTVSDYWRSQPFIGVALAATTLMLPPYVGSLLARLQNAYKAEQEASLSKSKFLAQASHDLRQPIHAISLFTACLRDAGLRPQEIEMVDNIDRSLQGVSHLFKSLLDVSTLDSGRVQPRFETVAVGNIVADVVTQNLESAQRNGCTVRMVPCTLHIIADKALLLTMLQNIVSNAVKYASGSKIVVGCRRRKNKVSVYVIDQGPGIAPHYQRHVFDEFYQIRERGDRDIEGVGLGLSIVKRLADVLGIEVQLQSVPGKGTSVSLNELKISRTPSFESRHVTACAPVGVAGLQILLVEDDMDVLKATASLLERWGCVVQAERSIPVKMNSCDLLITDYDLGNKITGTECITEVQRRLGKPVRAVIMSGHDTTRIRQDLNDDSIPILSKPVRPVELRSVIIAAAMEASSPPVKSTMDAVVTDHL